MQYVPSSGSHTFLAGPPPAIPPGPTLHASPCPPSTRSSEHVAPWSHPSRPSSAVGATAAVGTAIRVGVLPVAATGGDAMGAASSATAEVPNLGAAGAAALRGGGGAASPAAALGGGCSGAAAVAAAASCGGGGAAAPATCVVVARSPVSLSQKSSDARALANPQEGSIAAHRVAALRAGKNILASRNGFASALTTACQTQPNNAMGNVSDVHESFYLCPVNTHIPHSNPKQHEE